ncbi:MAG: hypothetical protein HY820_28615 [Acidobacteria bacterium]|nr:hypothetical protein [Acidobacteriota bacterium]
MLKTLLVGFSLTAIGQGQTLPAQAQALLDQAIRATPARYQFALEHGAQILPTTDGRSFYTVWLPPAAEAGKTPIVASLHGSTSWAFDEVMLWYEQAVAAGVGVVALQWWFGSGEGNDAYYTPAELHRELSAALKAQGNAPGTVALHGFSRGSANSYAVAAQDRASGDRFYSTIISNSGRANGNFPPNVEIASGKFGYNVFSGLYWTIFCGGKDPNPESECAAMQQTAQWVGRYGGVVDLMIEDANAPHGGFHMTPAHVKAALDAFLRIVEEREGALPAGAGFQVERDAGFEIRGASIPNVGLMGDEVWLVVGTRQGSRLYRSADGSQASLSEPVAGLQEAFQGTGYAPAEVVPRVLTDGRRALFVLGLGAPGSSRATVFRLVESEGGRFVREPPDPVFTDEPYVGVPDLADAGNGAMYLVYVALSGTPKNSQVAVSEDGGASFHKLAANPFGDIAVPNPRAQDINVDPAMLKLSRGGYLAVAMRAAKLYLFTGTDGRTVVPLSEEPVEPGTLSPGATGLFDPTLVELADGRVYLYATAGSAPDGSDSRVVRARVILPETSQ